MYNEIRSAVVSYRNSTSNHNFASSANSPAAVVSYRNSTSNHNSGWAQVHGRNNISWAKKFEYDVYYVDHIGFVMDVKVFFITIKKVLFRDDINRDGHATMEVFNGHN